MPKKTRGHYKLRDIVDAILWQLRTGTQWRNLPDSFPKWTSVYYYYYYYYRKWQKDGKQERLNAGLNKMERKRQGKGFVPLKWRWVAERTFGIFNFFRRLDKDYEKTTESQESWILWQNCQIILNRMN